MVAKEKTKTLVLLDVHAIIHRAYHALPDFTSPKGEATGALYGLSAMLIKIIRELEPDYVAACYDLPKPTFRHDVYKDYKAGRPEAEEDLVEQIKRSRDIFEGFAIPTFEAEGFEADDLIGTLAEKAKHHGDLDVIIASGDMDTLALVDDKKVRVYTLRKGIQDTVMYDEEKVKERFGFGPELLPDFKGLKGDPSDNIIGIKGIGEKTATTLIQEFGTLENIYAALKNSRETFKKKGIKERIVGLLEEGKEEAMFSKVLAQIRLDAPIELDVPKEVWHERFDVDRATDTLQELGFRSLISRLREDIGGGATSKDNEEGEPDEDELARVALALWLVDSQYTSPTLEDVYSYTGTRSFEKAKKIILDKIKEDNLTFVYEEIELPLMSILKRAEERGIKVDSAVLQKLSKKFHKELDSLEKDIWKEAGEEFNINSPKQLGEILYDKMGLSEGKVKKTEGGARSTRASELEKMQGKHPIIDKLLQYREFQKMVSTYVDNILEMLDERDRLHTRFIQTGTTTGRLSSQNPNMQNIPVRSELGKDIRQAFVADKGHELVAFDYSQVELRIAALLSGDERMKEIFAKGADFHAATASYMYGVKEDEVTKDMRRVAKTINFGILYGMGVSSLKKSLEVSQKEAQEFYNNYFETFTGLSEFLESHIKEVKSKGYTETLFGRRRYFPGLNSSVPYIRAAEERMAINAPIQGTNADMTKLAMVRVDEELKEKGMTDKAFLVLQIHDELIYEVKHDAIKDVAPVVRRVMKGVLEKDIPFEVDVNTGTNWAALTPLEI